MKMRERMALTPTLTPASTSTTTQHTGLISNTLIHRTKTATSATRTATPAGLLFLWLIVACSSSSSFVVSVNALSNKPLPPPPPIPIPIPITVLSGFLGSGKTTLLQHLLQNKQGLKIGVIVNDVASVNIDSKLVARDGTSDQSFGGGSSSNGNNGNSDGMVELQNGCACCSLSDELLTSVSQLVTMSDLRGDDVADHFQHIVIELSGVADPKAIRAKFQEACMEQMPLMERVQLDTLVSLVDCSTFESHFASTKVASRDEMPELYYRDGENADDDEEEEELEDWMQELPPKLLEAVKNGLSSAARTVESETMDGVSDLLVSQTETADVVVLNKQDLLVDENTNGGRGGDNGGGDHSSDGSGDAALSRLQDIVRALNPRATMLTTSFGKLDLTQILGVAGGTGVSMSGAVDDHRDAIEAVMRKECQDPDCTDESHAHSNSNSHSHSQNASQETEAAACTKPDCSDPSHSHSHTTTAKVSESESEDCADSECTDPSHSHSHAHEHAATAAAAAAVTESKDCAEPECTDPSHSHSHSHDHAATAAVVDSKDCAEPECTDPSHSHSHSHDDHAKESEVRTTHAGIGSFVYQARRPFHPGRLVSFLRYLPVVRGIPDGHVEDGTLQVSSEVQDSLSNCLRSKGFCWCANSHNEALYWSHAGSSFELRCLGQWWATLPRDQWPEGVDDYVLQDFDIPTHDDATNPVGVGDRRQEVVLIGQTFGNPMVQEAIKATLSECLLTDAEFQDYQDNAADETKLHGRFMNLLESKYVAY